MRFNSDVWSLGVTMLELLTRKEPYGDMPLAQVRRYMCVVAVT
jgi:serine/threonine protein kinase